MGLRFQSVIRMKLLVLLAFVALAQAEAQPDAVAAPEADADAGLLYGHHPYFNYGYYGFPGMCLDARGVKLKLLLMLMPMLMLVSCTAFTIPTTTSATMDIPGIS